MHRSIRLTLASLLLVAVPAWATPVTLQYTGNFFDTFTTVGTGIPYDESDRITATLELATALGAGFDGEVDPLTFSISDGRVTVFDDFGSLFSSFYFRTDGAGVITEWAALVSIDAAADGGGSRAIFQTSNRDFGFGSTEIFDSAGSTICGANSTFDPSFCGTGDGFGDSEGRVDGDAGRWSVVPVPAPSALVLMALALASFALRGRQRSR